MGIPAKISDYMKRSVEKMNYSEKGRVFGLNGAPDFEDFLT